MRFSKRSERIDPDQLAPALEELEQAIVSAESSRTSATSQSNSSSLPLAQPVVLFDDPLFLGPFRGQLNADAGEVGALGVECRLLHVCSASRSAKRATAKLMGHNIRRLSALSPYM
jgi:hypothetical protein